MQRQRVTGVIIRPGEEILLIRREIYEYVRGARKLVMRFWTVPGGGLKDHESHIMGLRREIHNEVGLDYGRSGSEAFLFREKNVLMPPGYPLNPNPPRQDEFYYLINQKGAAPELGEELKRKMRANPQHEYFLEWMPFRELPKTNLAQRDGPRRLIQEFLKVPIPILS